MSHDCDICPSCAYCVDSAPHQDDCDVAAEGTAPTATPTAQATPTDWPTAVSDEGAVALGEAVAVPRAGAYLVVDGVVRRVDSRWVELGPTRDGRIRWGVTTQSEVDYG